MRASPNEAWLPGLPTSVPTHCFTTRGGPVMSSRLYWTLVSVGAELLTTPTTDTCRRETGKLKVAKLNQAQRKPQSELELVQLEHRSPPIPAEGEPFFFSLQCVFSPLGVSE